MNVAQQLDMLQVLDLEMDRLKTQAAAIRAAVAEPASLAEARDVLQKAEAQIGQGAKGLPRPRL